MVFRRLPALRPIHRHLEAKEISSLFGSSTSNLNAGANIIQRKGVRHLNIDSNNLHGLCCRNMLSCSSKAFNQFFWNMGNTSPLHSSMVSDLLNFVKDRRLMTTQAKAPPQIRQMGAMNVSILSPGFVYEPYKPREPISFWRRWFTRKGWRRTKEDMIMELKNAYAVAKLRKLCGYSRQQFYQEALQLYKEINILMAKGNRTSLRKLVTENMYSTLKNEMKHRESMWKTIYWELVEPAVKIRTLRARMIGVDKKNIDKAFIQLTLEFLTKQKFAAYDTKGTLVSGDEAKEVLVQDIWVFERSLFHPGAYWRLCGRIIL